MMHVIALLVGILIFCVGLYYLMKEKDDAESRKIYMVTTIVGAVITLGMLAVMFLF